MRFLDFLFPPRDDEKILRDISVETFLSLITPQLEPKTRPATVILLPFHDTRVRSAIHEAKYHGSSHAFTLLGASLVEYLREADDLARVTSSRIRLVPVPLGDERRSKRGFNQVEEMATIAARELGVAVDTQLLRRSRETTSQVSLAREKRKANMRGAFTALRPADPSLTYVLIDDVITTGATLQAATRALQEAGAIHIIPIALAH
ncbi:MAG: putative phosphoribosyltransferase [Parcubacteria group bacterium]|nr:putative phosphoribosyltransferase [Parcubacteria group bacterium]